MQIFHINRLTIFLLIIMTHLCPKFDLWKKGSEMFPEEEHRVDRGGLKSFAKGLKTDKTDCFTHFFSDLDSAVSSGGLDQIMAPPAGQTPERPEARSFFQSVTVTKVLKPDGVSCLNTSAKPLWKHR